MDNRAQVSLEYLAIVAILVVVASVLALLSVNIFGVRTGAKQQADLYTEKIVEMIK